jgi:hypothetical protein
MDYNETGGQGRKTEMRRRDEGMRWDGMMQRDERIGSKRKREGKKMTGRDGRQGEGLDETRRKMSRGEGPA